MNTEIEVKPIEIPQVNKKANKPLPKETTFEKLGIYTNVSRVTLCFNQKGTNLDVTTKLMENQKKIDEFKKLENYNKINLSYKMLKKVRSAIAILEKNAVKSDPKSMLEFESIILKLKNGGLFKPVLKEEKIGEKIKKVFSNEKSLVLKYSDLYNVNNSLEDLKSLEGTILREYVDYINVYEERVNLLKSSVKFNNSVKATVTYLLQEAIADIIKLSIKDAKKDIYKNHTKIDVHNFRSEVIENSNYSILFYQLPAMRALKDFLERKAIYLENKLQFEEIIKGKNKTINKSLIKPFDEVERIGGYMKLVGPKRTITTATKLKTSNKKFWVGLNLDENSVNFTTYVVKIFDHVKAKVGGSKMYLTTRAREFVSNIMWQFLSKLSNMFDIHRNHRASVVNKEKGNTKVSAEKNIKFETVIEIFELLLCPQKDTNTFEALQVARDLRTNLKKIKTNKATI